MIEVSCAFLPCDQVDECGMVGGCTLLKERAYNEALELRLLAKEAKQEAELARGKALNGTKERANRDPVTKARKRKAIQP